MINIFVAYLTGLKNTWKQKKMLFFLYALNLLFAYLVSLPLSIMVEKALDETVMADKLLQAFDFTALASLIDEYGRGVSLGWNILVFAVCYGLLHTFFSGGIINIFRSPMNFSFAEFWSGSVKYFSRFFRLLLISAGVLIVIAILYLLISGLLNMLTANASDEFWPYVSTALKLLLLVTLLAWFSMVLDYTRIRIVLQESSKVYPAFKQTAGYVLKRFTATSVLYLCLIVTGLILLLVYLGLESLLPTDSAATVLLFFIVSQLYIVSRIWLRLNFYGVQMAYFMQD